MGIPLKANVKEGKMGSSWKLPSSRSRRRELLQVRDTLMLIEPPHENKDNDTFTWGSRGERKRHYSTKVGWELLRPREDRKEWSKAVWFKLSVPKHAFTFWVAHLNRLPLRNRLLEWGCTNQATCLMCNSGTEDRAHLFLHCIYAMEMWTKALLRLGQPQASFISWDVMIAWMKSTTYGLATTLKKIVVQGIIYDIWQERNKRLHSNPPRTAAGNFIRLDRTIRDILLAHRERKQELVKRKRSGRYQRAKASATNKETLHRLCLFSHKLVTFRFGCIC